MRTLEQRFHQLQKVVLALSGAHEEVLAFVPSERSRFESLGWAILITSGVATVSMWFALASAVGINGFLALPVALAWGLVIMGIDRWLIVSMPTDGTRKFAMAVPRLALALLLGTLISTPLVLRIFESEVNAQIAKMQQQSYSTFLRQQQASAVAKQVGIYSSELKYLDNVIATHGAATANTASDPELTAYNQQLTKLNTELAHWTGLKNKYYNDYTCQLYGGPTCPKKGFGPAAKDSLKNYQNASREVNTITGQINHVQKEIQRRDAQLSSNSKADQQARYQQALTQQPIAKNEYDTALQRRNELQATFFANNQAAHGILIRLEALSQLSDGNVTVTAARFLLFMLFLVIECLPVTVKIMQRPGLYEEALQEARAAERRDVSRFYRFRSRLISGPHGTAVLWPMLRTEPDSRIDAIWTRTPPALPGSAISEDDQLTEEMDDPAAPRTPGGRVDFGPTGSQADRNRPEQRWHGADRWLNHWQGQPAEDDAPLVGEIRPDGFDPASLAPEPRSAAHDNQGMFDSEEYSTHSYGEESFEDRGSLDDGWRDEEPHRMPGGQASPVSPGGGGTPLSWDDDE
jgi:hypothetical protein